VANLIMARLYERNSTSTIDSGNDAGGDTTGSI
jgi:hypothetical protein